MVTRIPLTEWTRKTLAITTGNQAPGNTPPATQTAPTEFAAASFEATETTRVTDVTHVTLPDVWNAATPAETGVVAYITAFELDASSSNAVYVECAAVFGAATVYVNDILAGEHHGGYSLFRFDITNLCRPGTNTVTIVADNTRYEDINPLFGDFSNYGGIYRPVTVLVASGAHFDPLHYGTCGMDITPTVAADGSGTVSVDAYFRGLTGGETLTLTIADEAGTVVEVALPVTAPRMSATLTVQNPHLWNGKQDPHLYRLTARLAGTPQSSAAAKAVPASTDTVSLSFGFRSISISPDTGLSLNGSHLRVNGVAKHQDFEGVMAATTRTHWEKDIALIKEIGANAVRLSHYQHPQEMYDLCDQEGFLVWAEIPLLSLPDGNTGVFQNAKDQLTELIYQNRHHPSIFCWGIQNEIAMFGESLEMYPKITELNALAKTLDPIRASACANLNQVENKSPLNTITDIVGYNLYYGWYYGEIPDYEEFFTNFHKDQPTVALGISEYGVDCSTNWHAAAPKRKDYSEEYQCLFHETAYPIMERQPFIWGTFIWNMFDFGSAIRNEGGVKGKNCKGLVTFDRATKKDSFYYYQAAWSRAPMVHIAGKRFAKRTAITDTTGAGGSGDTLTVKVYSNAPEVTLLVNGEPFATQAGSRVFVFGNVPFADGTTTVTARIQADSGAGTLEDTATFEKVAEPEKSYIFVDPNPGINVANWVTPQEGPDKLFPKDRYSIMDGMDTLKANPAVWAVLEEMVPQITDNPRNKGGSTMSLFQILGWMKGVYKEDYVKDLNRRLNEFKKE